MTMDARDLEVDRLTVAYGGNVAVENVSLSAPTRCITGLIGPNGAGKTTIFNVCSGLVRPSRGRIRLWGRDITAMRPAGRARLGLGRTFQRIEMCPSLSVRTNVALGAEARLAGGDPVRQVFLGRSRARQVRSATDEALAICGLADLGDAPAAALSTGQQRLVELARVLAGGFDMLLLDEPSSGLDDHETRRFGTILQRAVEERGVGILLVEHDMSLVMSVCDRVQVLDFGRRIFEGAPAECVGSDVVRAAYLGQQWAMAESGV